MYSASLSEPGCSAGMVNVLPNPRSSGMFGGQEQEFREGDRAWPGASVLELPDLSSIHLDARLDEAGLELADQLRVRDDVSRKH